MSEAPLQIDDVTNLLPTPEVWGSFKILGVDGPRLELFGWALGKNSEVERVEVLAGNSVIASTALDLARPDVAELHQGESAATCGFRVVIEAKGKGRSELELRAVLEDGASVTMGAVRVLSPVRRWDVFRRR